MENISNAIILIGALFGAVTTIVTALTVIMKKILNKNIKMQKKYRQNNYCLVQFI